MARSPRDDSYVEPARDLDELAALATAARKKSGHENNPHIPLRDFIYGYLKPFYKEKGDLEVQFFDQKHGQPPAQVDFVPARGKKPKRVILKVDNRVWTRALLGYVDDRYKIAHEVGHILLHDHTAKAFSNNVDLAYQFTGEKNSAEWQANGFAPFFLIPDFILEEETTAEAIATRCGAPLEAAQRRLTHYLEKRKEAEARLRFRMCEGDCCANCGNFSIKWKEHRFKCTHCGKDYFKP